MFYRTMWGGFGGRPIGPDLMWSAYFNGLLSVDLENMPEDAEPDPHVGMRPSLSPAPSPAKGPLSSSEGPMANGAPEDRPPRMNGAPEEEKIQEYLQRTDTAVIFPEPVGGNSPKKTEEKAPPTPEPAPVIEEPKVPNEYLLKCPHCDQVFSGQQAINELKEHLASSHKEANSTDANFVCQKCNASFTSKENLAKHKLFHATNGQTSTVSVDDDALLRKFKCSECGKAFKFKHHLKEHIRIHSGEKPFACANCGKRFSHSGSFSSHNTSKKCLVVNLKVRKVDSRSPRGRGTTQNNSFRPIIPKFSSPGGNGAAPRTPEMSLIPAGYMPSSERFSNFTGRPQQPYLPLPFHPLISQPHYHMPMGAFPEVSHLLQQRSRYENDIPPPGTEHHPHSQIPSHLVSPSSLHEKTEEADPGSPKPPGEMKAVKKILEIVDATVSKQQQSPTSQKPSNGLLSELLSSGSHSSTKSPPPQYGVGSNSRCRYCYRLFDSKTELYQHERYVCPHNTELRTKLEFSDAILENGNDVESAEESRHRISPSSLSVECVLMLKAHYQINPRPKKSELIRLSRDLKCPTRTVQDWFHNQQMLSKGFPVNGEITHSSSPLQQNSGFNFPSVIPPPNGHSFQTAVIPPYNGTLSSGSQMIPFRPIPERSPLLDSAHREEDQPLDLSVKIKSEESNSHQENSSSHLSSPSHCESEVLNLSQRSSRTPPKVSSPYTQQNRGNQFQQHEDSVRDSSQNHIQSSLLYKYMQMGVTNRRQSPQPEKSPVIAAPSSPVHSPGRVEQNPQKMPSPDRISYADHSSSPSVTTGSYNHTEEPTEGNPYSPSRKKMRLWNQGEGDESTLEDIPGAEDSSEGPGKMRKSWKMHKIENEEGMYACDQCDKMFSKQSSLARHKYEHSGQRPHKCDECGKAFKHKHHLTEHKRLHSGEKPFQCKKCLKRFSHSGSYSQHMNHRFSYCKPFHE